MSDKPQYILVKRQDLRYLIMCDAAINDMGYNATDVSDMMEDSLPETDIDARIDELNQEATDEVREIVANGSVE